MRGAELPEFPARAGLFDEGRGREEAVLLGVRGSEY